MIISLNIYGKNTAFNLMLKKCKRCSLFVVYLYKLFIGGVFVNISSRTWRNLTRISYENQVVCGAQALLSAIILEILIMG